MSSNSCNHWSGNWDKLGKGRTIERMKRNDDCARTILAFSICESWSRSGIAFGLMNAVALMHHCMIPPPESYRNANIARKHIDDILHAADCIFTGLSSMQLTIMAMLIYRSCSKIQDPTSLKRLIKMLTVVVFGLLLAMAIALPAMVQLFYYGHIDFWETANSFVEMIYILPIQTAAVFIFPFVFASASNAFTVPGTCKKDRSTSYGARVAILGCFIAAAGLLLDASLCNFVSTNAQSIKSSRLFNDIYHFP
eukprot:CAMPEP_0181089588 /NCGR_PEP_ID=MMETSP1071-20121207/7384_1 /TAXON_ID=35127 /ORGANISM="Thalassiosira sp., Strain NH16" /LENGTH=251 /DNA_ID=CAMNT_0023171549 /DNA_START=483 /DNA_END=1235 /DNA_ORIENTATION=+